MNECRQTAEDILTRRSSNIFQLRFIGSKTSLPSTSLYLQAYTLNKLALLPFHPPQIRQLYQFCLESILSSPQLQLEACLVTSLLVHLQMWHHSTPQSWLHTRTAFYLLQNKLSALPASLFEVLSKRAQLEPDKNSFLGYIRNLQLATAQVNALENICLNKQSLKQPEQWDLQHLIERDTQEDWEHLRMGDYEAQNIKEILIDYECLGLDRFLRRSLHKGANLRQVQQNIQFRADMFENVMGYKSNKFVKVMKEISSQLRKSL